MGIYKKDYYLNVNSKINKRDNRFRNKKIFKIVKKEYNNITNDIFNRIYVINYYLVKIALIKKRWERII